MILARFDLYVSSIISTNDARSYFTPIGRIGKRSTRAIKLYNRSIFSHRYRVGFPPVKAINKMIDHPVIYELRGGYKLLYG